MKATMNEHGVLTIDPETGAEAYALRTWAAESKVPIHDMMREETSYWRGSKLLLSNALPSANASEGFVHLNGIAYPGAISGDIMKIELPVCEESEIDRIIYREVPCIVNAMNRPVKIIEVLSKSVQGDMAVLELRFV